MYGTLDGHSRRAYNKNGPKGCRSILQINQSVEREIADRNGSLHGKLLVGVSALMGEYLLPRILNNFEHAYPHIDLELREARACDLQDLVAAGKVDRHHLRRKQPPGLRLSRAAPRPRPHPGTALFCRRAPRDPPRQRFSADAQMLNGQPFITLRKGTGMHQVTEAFFEKFAIMPGRIRETDNIHIANILVRLNRGFALVSNMATRNFFYNDAESAYCTMASSMIERTIYACSRRNEYRTEAERFLTSLIASTLSAGVAR